MTNYEKEPHIVTIISLYFAIFVVYVLDTLVIFLILMIVNYFYSLSHVNINVDDLPAMNLISSLLISLFLLFKKRKAISESGKDFINGMNKIL